MSLARWVQRVPLSILLLWALLASAPFNPGPGHVHQSASHCCDLCHVQHTPPLQALPVFALSRPTATERFVPLAGTVRTGEPPAIAHTSRGPPA